MDAYAYMYVVYMYHTSLLMSVFGVIQAAGELTGHQSKKKKLFQYSGPEPPVDAIEAEFWRIVEDSDEVRGILDVLLDFAHLCLCGAILLHLCGWVGETLVSSV
jgi:hypothetical protein